MGYIWTTHNGIEVTVDSGGDFTAEVNGVFLRSPTWASLRLKIEAESKSNATAAKLHLECVVLLGDQDSGDFDVRSMILVGLNRNDSTFRWQDSTKKPVIYALPDSPENTRLLEQLAVAKSTVRDIELAIHDRIIHETRWGGRIEPTAYGQQLKDLQQRYDLAAANTPTAAR